MVVGFVYFLITYRLDMKKFSIIYLFNKSEKSNYLKRNKDQLITSIITAAVGAAIGAGLTLLITYIL